MRAGRLHHAPRAGAAGDAAPHQRRAARALQEGRAHREHGARRADRRGGAGRRDRVRPRRRRRARRVRVRAARRQAADVAAAGRRHAAHRGVHARGAGAVGTEIAIRSATTCRKASSATPSTSRRCRRTTSRSCGRTCSWPRSSGSLVAQLADGPPDVDRHPLLRSAGDRLRERDRQRRARRRAVGAIGRQRDGGQQPRPRRRARHRARRVAQLAVARLHARHLGEAARRDARALGRRRRRRAGHPRLCTLDGVAGRSAARRARWS